MPTVHYHHNGNAVTIRIERAYKVRPDEWEEIDEGTFLLRTEWAGYWKKGTALQTLKDAGQLSTPWAFYRIQRQARDYSGRRSGLGDGPMDLSS